MGRGWVVRVHLNKHRRAPTKTTLAPSVFPIFVRPFPWAPRGRSLHRAQKVVTSDLSFNPMAIDYHTLRIFALTQHIFRAYDPTLAVVHCGLICSYFPPCFCAP